MHTRTGPQARARNSLYRSGRFSLPSFSTARLMTCQRGCTGRTLVTSSNQREVIQAQGHSGSNQTSTGISSCSATSSSFKGKPAGRRRACAAVNREAAGHQQGAVTVACNGATLARIPRGMAGFKSRAEPQHGAGPRKDQTTVTNNLTRDEAHDRAALIQAVSYQVELDLTAGEETF